ncbi:MAG: MATE family efflux transporter [Pseudomonadota bacterium]
MSVPSPSAQTRPLPGAGAVVALSWPMTLKAMFLHGTVVIDGWLVSSLGEEPLAAMGLAVAVGGLVSGAIFAFSNALQLRTAQAFGTGDAVFRKSVLASGLTVGLCFGVAGVLAIFLFGQTLLSAIAPSQTLADQAWTYLSIFSIVLLAEAVGQNLASHFNGCGRSKLPLVGYCLSVPVNITLSAALIHGLWGLPALGITGAALGSAVAVAIQAMYLALQLWRIEGALWRVPGWRNGTYAATLKRHLAFAWPIAITFISANYASRVCMLIYAQMSLSAFAAMTLIMPWIMVAGTIGMQWAQATGILVAQLLGEKRSAQELDRFLSAGWRASFGAALAVALGYLGICLASGVLYPALDAETRRILSGFAVVLVVLPFPKQSNAICGNTLRASGDTIYVMHLFVWTQWVFRVPATLLAVLYYDLPAVWVLSLLFWEEILKFPLFHSRLWKGRWKRADVTS